MMDYTWGVFWLPTNGEGCELTWESIFVSKITYTNEIAYEAWA